MKKSMKTNSKLTSFKGNPTVILEFTEEIVSDQPLDIFHASYIPSPQTYKHGILYAQSVVAETTEQEGLYKVTVKYSN